MFSKKLYPVYIIGHSNKILLLRLETRKEMEGKYNTIDVYSSASSSKSMGKYTSVGRGEKVILPLHF